MEDFKYFSFMAIVLLVMIGFMFGYMSVFNRLTPQEQQDVNFFLMMHN